MKTRINLSLIVVLAILAGGVLIASAARARQTETVVLQPGQAAVCATCIPCATDVPTVTPIPPTDTSEPPTVTSIPPTDTPIPSTDTPIPPTDTPPPPTSTSEPGAVEFGVVRTANDVWPTVMNELDADFVEYRVTSSMSDETILAALDYAEDLGLKVLLNFYVSGTNTNKPWYLDDAGNWQIQPRGIEVLQLVEDHPALWAIYQLHEPFDSSKYHADADAQRALYAFLRNYTGAPLYTDIASLYYPDSTGEVLSDGMCDYCCTFSTHWPEDPTERIDREVAVWRRTMTNSQLVVMINTYDLLPNYVMPTAQQIENVQAYLCGLRLPYLLYPWSHGGYTRTLDDATELWPVIAAGCGGVAPPPTDTPLPVPTDTPHPSNATIIDHTAYANDLTIEQLDTARDRVIYFTHKSIGSNILTGMDELEAKDPERYSIFIRYSNGIQPGLNNYQVGSNGDPYSKIDGFASTVKGAHELAFMKFCVGDFQPFRTHKPMDVWVAYKAMMSRRNNVIWWTLPLTSESDGRGLEGFAEFNEAVRSHVAENGGILFDLADIESDGGRCQGDGYEALCNEWTSDGAHLSEAGRQRMASALWVLLATEK